MSSSRERRPLRLLPRAAAPAVLAAITILQSGPIAPAQESGDPPAKTSYDQIAPVLLGKESFQAMMAKDKADKAAVMARQKKLLEERYDLTPRPDDKVTMSRGKPIQVGPTAKLPEGMTWEQLAAMSSRRDPRQGTVPQGISAPAPPQARGRAAWSSRRWRSSCLPALERFDVDFDLPEHFLPEFPPAIYLTTRPDLGDVSQGKVVTVDNFQELFAGILNAKDLEGLRLLVTQFPQQQFNATADRKTEKPAGMQGVACFDCHVNGHTSAATHLVGDIRPQIAPPPHRHAQPARREHPAAVRLAAGAEDRSRTSPSSSSGRPTSTATRCRRRPRGSTRWSAAARSTSWRRSRSCSTSRRPRAWAWTASSTPRSSRPDSPEMRGQTLFFGKAQCATCHPAPFYTDNLMHDLKVDRFYKTQTINGLVATTQGPIKTFPLRGIKESPPYFHDGRLLTLEDTVEFFNLILELKLTSQEKADLVAFMRQL